MSDFYIVPPRLIVGSLQRSNVVTSLNTLRGDLSFKVSPDTGLTLNINSGVFNLSIQPDFYIKKSGDIVPSNIIFQPDAGKYGLAVGSGAADPGIGVSGALYFNTTYGVLKVYNGTVWNEIASTGTSGITQSFADTRYLRLDGANVPTGAISMGSQFLGLANLTTRAAAGTAGQVYYNTDTNKLDFYNGSSWVPVGSGITQLNAGNGITLSSNPITSYGTVGINEAYNFNWTGTHTYTQPITFSTSQTFDASKLTIAYEVQGDILRFNGANWSRLPLGTANQVLSVSNCGGDVEWHTLAAGPGIAITYSAGSLIFSSLSASGISGINYLNNLTNSTQYFATGTSGSDFNIVSSGSTHTFNIPIAGIGATGLVSTLDQSFAGNKTFTNNLIVSSSIASTTTSIGALVVRGGVGVGQTINLDGSLNFWNGSYYTGFKSSSTASTTYILPQTSPATGTSVLSSDTIGNLSWVPMTASGGSGTTTIGIPTDGVYTDGFFSTWTDNTTISNAFDDVNELLALLAPARPNYLTGTSLVVSSVPTYYTVRISAGLGTEWYQAGYGTGSLITSKYYLSGAHTLNTANTTTTFSAGSLTTSTYGTIYFRRYNYLTPTGSGGGVGTVDLTTNYTVGFTNNNLRLSALGTYNSIWTKANAQISAYTQPFAGYEGVYIAHTENNQLTNTYEMWRDPWSASNGSPVFSQAATAATYSQSDKWLSGISYYASGTGFSVYFKGAAGIYSCAYNVTQVYAISATGLNTSTGLPASPPLFTDELDKSGSNHVRVSLSVGSQSSFNKYLTTTIYKAHGTTAASNATIAKAINTYGTTSTDTFDGFQDEARRLVIGSGIAFTSTLEMASGNAQVRSGTLQYPLASDYDTQWGGTHTFSGDQEYQRYFYKTSASTGTLTFGGFTASNIAPYGTGNINVLLFLDGDALWFDLGVLQGSNSNNGSTRSAAISAKTSASGGALGWSIGVKTTGVSGAGNSARYRAVVIFRNNTYSMTSITSS
jgi:hypothetical protein